MGCCVSSPSDSSNAQVQPITATLGGDDTEDQKEVKSPAAGESAAIPLGVNVPGAVMRDEAGSDHGAGGSITGGLPTSPGVGLKPPQKKALTLGPDGAAPTYNRLALPHSFLQRRYDVIVMGSGYGASIAALRAAQHGQSVCVLEKGKEKQPGEYPEVCT